MADEIAHLEAEEDQATTAEPKSSKYWLEALAESEKAFEDYQRRCDNIDKLFADLRRLGEDARDRQFQLFWANIQVLGPSIYARTPVPVVVPKFKDRRPLYRVASELLERSTVVSFDLADINSLMLLIRDDLTISGRGVPWVRYETKADGDYDTERLCYDFKDRHDFLHELARNWPEVGWVAGASYMTQKAMRKRFSKTSGDEYKQVDYSVQKDDVDNGGSDKRRKAKVWEIWDKDGRKVIWVAEGGKKILDEGKPHLKLEGFFPCPKPAYATLQRRSLIPIPDVVYYKDQLEEINQLTNRVHALADAIKVRGFYPAGAAEIGDAVEAAIKSVDDRQVLIPIANWAAFGTTSGDPIVWLPIEVIANTVAGLVELRKQVIDDVYQIMGLSDIMRGSTEKEETLGAQELKAQFGSVRIRDKQSELVRIARDMVRIGAEIMAENFSADTLLAMSQMQIESDADVQQKIEGVVSQADQQFQQASQQAQQAAAQQPEAMPQIQQQMQQFQQQLVQQTQEQIQKLQETVTIEQVMAFLRDQRIRPFVLDIETDSTIAPDEQAEKAARTEFVQALGGMLQQFLPVVQGMPQAAPLVGGIIKFALAPFRAGRELEGQIDEAVDALGMQAQQPQPNPEMEKLEKEMELKQQELAAKAKIEQDKAAADKEAMAIEAKLKADENAAKMAQIQAQTVRDEKKGVLEVQKLELEIANDRQQAIIQRQEAVADRAARENETKLKMDGEREKQGFAKDQHKMAVEKMGAESKAKRMEAGWPDPDDSKMELIQGVQADMSKGMQSLAEFIAQQQQIIAEGQRESREALQQLMRAVLAESELIKDPKTGKATGSRKVLN